MARLKRLIAKRGIVKQRLTSLEKFLEKLERSQGPNFTNELKERLQAVTGLSSEFAEIHIEIVDAVTPDEGEGIERGDKESAASASARTIADGTLQVHEDEAENIENRIFKIKAQLRTLIEENETVSSNRTSPVVNPTTGINNTHYNVNLPIINLPQFDVAYSDWATFYEAFDSLIHGNPNLNECQKFYYLRSCLKNEPLRSIESLSIKGTNYQAAWAILKRRYENKRLIVTNHIQSILNFPDIVKASASGLRKLLDSVNAHLEALKILEIPIQHWDQILILILLQKLDYHSKREWESTLNAELVNYETFSKFLEKKCLVLESLDASKQQRSINPIVRNQKISMSTTQSRVGNQYNKFACFFCNKPSHFVTNCEALTKLKVADRIKEVRKRNLCINCLRNNHGTNECRSEGCKTCKARHHTLLHENPPREAEEQVQQSVVGTANATKRNPAHNQVLLSTAVVLIKDANGDYQKCRALLDVGSQLNLISKALCERLKLNSETVNLSISGVGKSCSESKQSVSVTIRSCHKPFTRGLHCFVLSKITEELPLTTFDKRLVDVAQVPDLADDDFNISRPIDILVGAPIFWDLILPERRRLSNSNLMLIESRLGWLVGNTGVNTNTSGNASTCHHVTASDGQRLDDLIEQFWIEQEVPNTKEINQNEEEKRCEKQFIDTHKRDHDGRFIVQLPFRDYNIGLGNSKASALKRFYNLERKFRKDPKFKQIYSQVLSDYLENGLIERVPTTELENASNVYYLPHRAVVKPESVSTKLRIVFDASCKTDNQISLNDVLMTGPNIQNDLVSLLTRFRTHQVVLSADIKQMFLQIKIDPKHLNYLRFFWRSSCTEEMHIYRWTRLVFGLTNSPFTAMRCIRQLSTEATEKYPVASAVLSNEIFMDDILTGSSCLDEAIKLKKELINILGSAGFELGKFASNDPGLCPKNDGLERAAAASVEIYKGDSVKTLGLYWNQQSDELHFKYRDINRTEKTTKRDVLSTIARLYDPLGLIAPLIVKAKLIMQSLWGYKDLTWDSYIPTEIEKAWEAFMMQLPDLDNLRINRKVVPRDTTKIDLVAFGDASLDAYGAAIYIRAKTASGVYVSNLVIAKTRLAPVRSVSLPRLELNAAVLAARLMDQTAKSLNLEISNRFYFTDSMIVLHYINKPANNWQVYVARRVSEIQTLTNVRDWLHVESKQNPADILSRGVYMPQLNGNQLYWTGPDWLKNERDSWPENRFKPLPDESSLERRNAVLIIVNLSKISTFSKISCFDKLVRIIAYCFRFVRNCKRGQADRTFEPFSTIELKNARLAIIKNIQHVEFAEEIAALEKGKTIAKNSKLKALNPFIGVDGLLRVGGRLRNSDYAYDEKHPIVLPAKDNVTKLIIKAEHIRQLHAGATQTLAAVRREYWPLRPRNLVRQIIYNCYRCFHVNPTLLAPIMGHLPKERIQQARPFKKVGLDYFGPLYLRLGNKRSKKTVKAWGVLFVCLVTKAVHLELVGDLTSESFKHCLQRVISRRGKITHIFCDNATTFVGAKREMDEIINFSRDQNFYKNLQGFFENERITWKFIPPKAPNVGGLWERLVRSAKQHIKRVVGNTVLNWEEMCTFLTRIEAVMNSRPLTPLSTDSNDLQTLTPGHFLIGEPLTCFTEPDLTEVPSNRLSRWQHIEQLRQHFWKRWSREVLTQLHARTKWTSSTGSTISVGTLVLIAEDNVPPLCWRTGRVLEIFRGSDGVIRVANIQTARGVIKRSVRKLCVLPNE